MSGSSGTPPDGGSGARQRSRVPARGGAGRRLAGLAGVALVVSLLPPVGGAVVAGAVAVGLVCVTVRSPPVARALRNQLKPLLFVAGFVMASVGVFSGLESALIATARITGLFVIAGIVATTTPPQELMTVIARLLSPLRRFGVDPSRIALLVSLTITVAPVLLRHAGTVRDAQRMRGLRVSPRFVLPLLVLALRHADTMADSLTARGI